MMQLQRKVKVEKFFGGVNRKEKNPDAIKVTDVPKKFIEEMKATAGKVTEAVKKEIYNTIH